MLFHAYATTSWAPPLPLPSPLPRSHYTHSKLLSLQIFFSPRQASAIRPQERKSSFVGCTPESQGSPSQPSQTAFVSATSNHSLRLSGFTCLHSSWPRVLPSHCRRCVGSVQPLLTSPGHIPPVPGLMLLPWGFPVATKM